MSRKWNRVTSFVNRHKRHRRFRDLDALAAIEPLRDDQHIHRHTRRTFPFRSSIKADRIADLYRGMENDFVHGNSNPSVIAVFPCLHVTRLVEITENDAAEYCSVIIGVLRHRNHAQRRHGRKSVRRGTRSRILPAFPGSLLVAHPVGLLRAQPDE